MFVRTNGGVSVISMVSRCIRDGSSTLAWTAVRPVYLYCASHPCLSTTNDDYDDNNISHMCPLLTKHSTMTITTRTTTTLTTTTTSHHHNIPHRRNAEKISRCPCKRARRQAAMYSARGWRPTTANYITDRPGVFRRAE